MRKAPGRYGLILLTGLLVALLPQRALALLNNGANAIDVLGQFSTPSTDTTPNYNKGCVSNGASPYGFYIDANDTLNGVAIDAVHHYLFIADLENARVLVYTLSSSNALSTAAKTPTYVLGQADFYACTHATTQSNLRAVTGLAVDTANNRLFVADADNNRVMVYSTASMSNGMNASYVLGQATYTTNAAATSQARLNGPSGLAYDATRGYLFVGDSGNNRVLVFNVATGTITSGENASFVLGQGAYTTAIAAANTTGMSDPTGVAYDGTHTTLYVADRGNNRVLAFNAATGSLATLEAASYVLGEPDFTTVSGGTTQPTLNGPMDVSINPASSILYVTDGNNNRAMVFNVAAGTIANGENAVHVLGHTDFTTGYGAVSQNNFNAPSGLAYDATNSQIYLFDGGSNRVLVLPTASITDGENASDLIGQYASLSSPATVDYTKSGLNNGPDALGFNQNSKHTSVAMDSVHHRLFVGDINGDRILVYTLNTDNSFSNAAGGHTANYVIGQPNFAFGGGSCIQNQIIEYADFAFDYDPVHDRLFVADANNARILVFNTATITNGMNAAYVLGQDDFTSCSSYKTGTGTPTQSGLSTGITGIAYDRAHDRLFVTDSNSNRVLVFSTATITNGMNASNVLGPSGFTATTTGRTQARLSQPGPLAYDPVNNRLFVSDVNNSRVMVYSTATITNGMNAAQVIGQTSFTAGNSGCTANLFTQPRVSGYDPNNGRLFVSDFSNGRVLIFNTSPGLLPTNNATAVAELGQSAGATAFTTCTNTLGPTQSAFNTPSGGTYDPATGKYFLLDTGSNRILVFEASYLGSSGATPGYE